MAISKPLRTEVQPGVWLDNRRAVYFETLGALAVADLHWGYAAAHRAAGNLLPLWGDEAISQGLLALLADYAPREMIWLGDSIHAVSGRRTAEHFLTETAPAGLPISILAGNHDRRWAWPTVQTLERGAFVFHHGDVSLPQPSGSRTEVVGHFHPAAGLYDGAGTRVRVPALVASSARLILPAFSPWAAGVPWNDQLQPTEILWAIAPSRIFAVRSAHPRFQAGRS